MADFMTPPRELVQQWSIEAEQNHQPTVAYSMVTALATRAAQWGADQELEACCEYVYERLKLTTVACIAQELRVVRRPKEPSLKEQALEQMEALESHGAALCNLGVLRRALEALPND
jgi:hypothetical protein